MISSLLKHRRLRIQLLVGLLLVLGTFPEPSESRDNRLICYMCDDDEPPRVSPITNTPLPNCKNPREEDIPMEAFHEGLRHCGSIVRGDGDQQKVLKFVYQNNAAKCLSKAFSGHCKGATEEAEVDRVLNAANRCIGEEKNAVGRKQSTGNESTKPLVTVCTCANNDRCNKDRFCGSGSCDYTRLPGGYSSSSILHPFNSIIITLLTLAFYNYN